MIDARDKENRFNAIAKGKCIDASKLSRRKRKKLLALPKLFRIAEWQIWILCGGIYRWTNEGGGDRDEREIESREDTLGWQLRYR